MWQALWLVLLRFFPWSGNVLSFSKVLIHLSLVYILTGLKNLKVLNLAFNNITDACLVHLKGPLLPVPVFLLSGPVCVCLCDAISAGSPTLLKGSFLVLGEAYISLRMQLLRDFMMTCKIIPSFVFCFSWVKDYLYSVFLLSNPPAVDLRNSWRTSFFF